MPNTEQGRTQAMADPTSANSAVAAAYDDHEWKPAVLDMNTTDGIRNTIRAQAAAIQALADKIDGLVKHDPRLGQPHQPTNHGKSAHR